MVHVPSLLSLRSLLCALWNFPARHMPFFQICRCIRGEGPPALRQSDRVPDETQAARYEREREHRRQIDHIQDDHQPDLLLPLASSTSSTDADPPTRERPAGDSPLAGVHSNVASTTGVERTRYSTQQDGDNARAGAGTLSLPRPRKLMTLGSYKGGLAFGAGGGVGGDDGLSLPPASMGASIGKKSWSVRRPAARDRERERDRARAVAAVPYPTIRSLRKS